MALVQNQVCGLVIAAQRALQAGKSGRAGGRTAEVSTGERRHRAWWQQKAEVEQQHSGGGCKRQLQLTTIVRPSFVITDTVAAGRRGEQLVLEQAAAAAAVAAARCCSSGGPLERRNRLDRRVFSTIRRQQRLQRNRTRGRAPSGTHCRHTGPGPSPRPTSGCCKAAGTLAGLPGCGTWAAGKTGCAARFGGRARRFEVMWNDLQLQAASAVTQHRRPRVAAAAGQSVHEPRLLVSMPGALQV